MTRILKSHRDSIHKFSDTRFVQAVSAAMAHPGMRSIQYDSLVTVNFGGSSPPFPFSDVQAYYKHGSSYDKLDTIRIPFLALNADDDPIIPWAPQGYDRNEWFTLVVTCGGGHMGWFQSSDAVDRWIRRPVLEWLRATAEDVILEPRKVREIEWRDGWLVENGSEHLGCREIGYIGATQGTGRHGDQFAGL
jgi:uncharacterized protein